MHGSFRKFIRESIHESQKCQRNWDLSQQMPEEDIKLIVEAATNAPSKQNQNLFVLHVIQDRELIEVIHGRTRGFGTGPEYQTNSQVLAHLLLAFAPSSNLSSENPESFDDVDTQQAIGIAAGYTNLVATQLGYASGCCRCFDSVSDLFFGQKVALLMGVGIPDAKRHRQEHHVDPDFTFPTLRKLKDIQVIAH